MKMTTTSPRETELLGEHLARQLKGGEVLALFGGMGMGKTAFTRGLAPVSYTHLGADCPANRHGKYDAVSRGGGVPFHDDAGHVLFCHWAGL